MNKMQVARVKSEFMNPVLEPFNDLNDAYFGLIWNLWEYGRKYLITSGSFEGSHRLEFDFCAGFIKYPHSRPLSPIMPEGIPPTVTDTELETKYFPNYLMNPELEKNEHYKYSSWINGCDHYSEFKYCPKREDEYVLEPNWKPNVLKINTEGIDSPAADYAMNDETPLEWVIRHFKEKGYGNNHCYINVGNVDSGFNYDIPYENEAERRTSPCLRGIDFKIKDHYLIMSCVFRSWDLYAGFPENMGGLTLLNEYVADQLHDVFPGPLAFSSAGLHAYDYQLEPIMTILRKNLDDSVNIF